MYAIAFDFDTDKLSNLYGTSYNNAYGEIRKTLEADGFNWQQGSLYFGDPSMDLTKCFMSLAKLSKKYSWFVESLRDIRLLHIDELNDLLPIVREFSQSVHELH